MISRTYLGLYVPLFTGELILETSARDLAISVLFECSKRDMVGSNCAMEHCSHKKCDIHA